MADLPEMSPATYERFEVEAADAQRNNQRGVKRIIFFNFVVNTLEAVVVGSLFDCYLYSVSSSNETVGSMETVKGSIGLLLAVPLGYIADKFSRPGLLKSMSIVYVLAVCFLVATIVVDRLTLMYFAIGLYAVATQSFDATTTALIGDYTEDEGRDEAMSRYFVASWLGSSVGPGIQAGVLLGMGGGDWSLTELHVILACGILCVPLAVPVVWTLKEPLKRSDVAKAAVRARAAQQGLDSPLAPPTPKRPALAWTEETVCGIRKAVLVPVTLEIRNVLTLIGSGMTIKFFPLFFKNDYAFTAFESALLATVMPLGMAVMARACTAIGKSFGRVQVVTAVHYCGPICLFALCLPSLPWWVAVPLYIARLGIMNAGQPVSQSIVLDAVPPQYRARWAALGAIKGMTWSGSAVLGGMLSDVHDYRYAFFITAIVHTIAGFFLLPNLWWVPRQSDEAPNEDAEVLSIASPHLPQAVLSPKPGAYESLGSAPASGSTLDRTNSGRLAEGSPVVRGA